MCRHEVKYSLQAQVFEALNGVQGVVGVRLQVAQLDCDRVFGLLKFRGALRKGGSPIVRCFGGSGIGDVCDI
jgi:hypothetical protein